MKGGRTRVIEIAKKDRHELCRGKAIKNAAYEAASLANKSGTINFIIDGLERLVEVGIHCAELFFQSLEVRIRWVIQGFMEGSDRGAGEC